MPVCISFFSAEVSWGAICSHVDAFAVLICVAAVFGMAGNEVCGAEASGVIIDAGTLGDGVGVESGSSFAFARQVYTVMVDAGGLRVVVVVCAAAVEVVVYVMMIVGCWGRWRMWVVIVRWWGPWGRSGSEGMGM